MGSCSYRDVPKVEIDLVNNSIHDSRFFKRPDLLYLDELNLKNPDLAKLASIMDKIKIDLKALNAFIPYMQKKIQSKFTPKLLIEVKKAKNIKYKGLCISDPKPFIEIELSPIHIFLKTDTASPDLPVWFKLFVYKNSFESVRSIIVKVFQKNSSNRIDLIAKGELEITELINQLVYEKWVDLLCEHSDDSASVLVRILLIKDPQTLYHEHLSFIKNTCTLLKDAYIKCRFLLSDDQASPLNRINSII